MGLQKKPTKGLSIPEITSILRILNLFQFNGLPTNAQKCPIIISGDRPLMFFHQVGLFADLITQCLITRKMLCALILISKRLNVSRKTISPQRVISELSLKELSCQIPEKGPIAVIIMAFTQFALFSNSLRKAISVRGTFPNFSNFLPLPGKRVRIKLNNVL